MVTDSNCDVCGQHQPVGVAEVPGVSVSVAYCSDCLRANAHPYGIMVGNTACLGGYDQAIYWWQQMVNDTLTHLDKTREQFDVDVLAALEQLDEEDCEQKPIPPTS